MVMRECHCVTQGAQHYYWQLLVDDENVATVFRNDLLDVVKH